MKVMISISEKEVEAFKNDITELCRGIGIDYKCITKYEINNGETLFYFIEMNKDKLSAFKEEIKLLSMKYDIVPNYIDTEVSFMLTKHAAYGSKKL